MKFERRYQPWLVASKDASRPVLTHVNLTINTIDGERVGFLDATNSYVMVRVPCELHADDTAGPILVASLKHAAKTGQTKYESAELACVSKRCETPDGYAWPRPEVGAFPDFDKIISGPMAAKPAAGEFGISGVFLALVQRAMGSTSGVGLKVSGGRKAIVVASRHTEALGLIMPIVLS